jgi:hypothetical protein
MYLRRLLRKNGGFGFWSGHARIFQVGSAIMKRLPTTGTGALLELLSRYIPDDLINALWRRPSGPGRPVLFSPAQLFRITLLPLLTPAHSFNLVTELLPEQRSWRSFARLRNRHALPDVRMLHDFRTRLQLTQLRRVNEQLLEPLLEGTSRFAKNVAVIDSTDLPAATNAYKKIPPASTVRIGPTPVVAAAKRDRAVISLATKSTRCGSGFAKLLPAFCWCH